MRRTALLVCFLLVVGCQQLSGSTALSPPSVTAADEPDDAEPIRWPSSSDPDGIHERFVVGDLANASFDGDVRLYVWNDAPRPRVLTVTLVSDAAGERIHEFDNPVPAGEVVVYQFGQPGNYSVSVATPRGSHRLSIPRDEFDCNDRTSAIRVFQNGTTKEARISTELACGS